MGALVGVSITKLFDLVHGEETSERYLWLTAALSCGVAILLMTITNTVHPPAGKKAIFVSFTMSSTGFFFFRSNFRSSVHYARSEANGLGPITDRPHLVTFADVRGANHQQYRNSISIILDKSNRTRRRCRRKAKY